MFYENIYTKERTETFDNELKIKKIYILYHFITSHQKAV